MNIFVTLFSWSLLEITDPCFSPLIYGLRASGLSHKSKGKIVGRNLQYGPQTRGTCMQEVHVCTIITSGSMITGVSVCLTIHCFYFAGVHVMLKTSSGVRYALYSLASSKPEPGGTMPKDCAAFLSQPGARDIQLHPTGDVRTSKSYF